MVGMKFAENMLNELEGYIRYRGQKMIMESQEEFREMMY